MEVLYDYESRNFKGLKSIYQWKIQTKNENGQGLAEVLIFSVIISFLIIHAFEISKTFNTRKNINVQKFKKQWKKLEYEN